MTLAGSARVWVWVAVVVTGLATVGLILVAFLADPDTTEQIVGVVGAVVAWFSWLVSVIALLRGSSSGSRDGRRVRGGRNSVVAGGNITGSAIGKNSKVTGPRTRPGSTSPRGDTDDVRSGRDGIATGGDITDSALGEGSER